MQPQEIKRTLEIKPHNVRISQSFPEGEISLEPLSEAHLPWLLSWNQDKEILSWVEVEPDRIPSSEEIHAIYAETSQKSLCFAISYQGNLVGECWLQPLEMKELQAFYKEAGQAAGRIDLLLGEKEFWNQGIGTRVVSLLTDYSFSHMPYTLLFAFMREENMRSRSIFRKNGYQLVIPPTKDFPFCGYRCTKSLAEKR